MAERPAAPLLLPLPMLSFYAETTRASSNGLVPLLKTQILIGFVLDFHS
jgi:hypothetical protein